MKDPIAHITKHAALGEEIVALVKASGLVRKARRAKRQPKTKGTAKKTAGRKNKNPLAAVKET